MVESYMPRDDLRTYADMLRQSVRVSFPVRGIPPTALREVAEVLRQIAWECERLAHGMDIPEHRRMLDYQFTLEELRSRLKRIAKLHGIDIKEGRPTNAERGGHNGNSYETVSGGEITYPQQFVSRRHQ